MKPIQFKASIDEENGVFSIVKSASFSAFRVAREDASVITSKKSPYADKFSHYGVYILVEDDCKNPLKFYVGKAGKISSRFVPHVSKTSVDKLNLNWTDAIIFVSTSDTFPWGEDEIAWFEYWLLKSIIDAKRYQYTNKPDQTKLGVVDEVDCEHQLSDMKLLVSLFGYPKLFLPIEGVEIKKDSKRLKSDKSKSLDKKHKGEFYGYTAIAVRALFDHLFEEELITDTDIKSFTADSSHAVYCKSSASGCVLMVPFEKRSILISRQVRYYDKPYVFNGKKYALSSQLFKQNLVAFMSLANSHGITRADWLRLCEETANMGKFFDSVGI